MFREREREKNVCRKDREKKGPLEKWIKVNKSLFYGYQNPWNNLVLFTFFNLMNILFFLNIKFMENLFTVVCIWACVRYYWTFFCHSFFLAFFMFDWGLKYISIYLYTFCVSLCKSFPSNFHRFHKTTITNNTQHIIFI